jgi:2-methylcitrate dehydratase PrpD
MSETPTISEHIAGFSAGLAWEDIPESARMAAKLLMLDAAGISFASTTYPFAAVSMRGLASFEAGASVVIGFADRLPLRDAVLMNGILAHGLDFDDTHLVGVVHPTASCFPTALGLAAAAGRSGRDIVAAYIRGIEVAARIGAVAKGEMNQVGFHPTGVVAAFGCAVAAAHLYGLDAEKTAMAQGIVLSMASGTREYSADGAWSKRLHPGWAGFCGITAAALARAGFTGPRTAYEGRFGLFATHLDLHGRSYDLGAATAGLGEVWEVSNVAVKPFPACQLSIACIDAALTLARTRKPDPRRIKAIEAVIPPHAVAIVCEPAERKRQPRTSYEAQFSLPFDIACALIRGRFGVAEIELYGDAEIRALAERVRYRVDPDTNYPIHFSGEVIVEMEDGEVIAQREDINRGAPDRPLTEADLREKFMGNALMALPRARAEEIADRILALEEEKDARLFAEALAGAARPDAVRASRQPQSMEET